MKIVTVGQMVALEQATDAAGFSYNQMMAAAGAALAATVRQQIPAAPPGPILCLIGPGNNGGDGLVACARLQDDGIPTIPYIWKRKETDDPLLAAARDKHWADHDPDFSQLRALIAQASIIIDALLGTGSARPIAGSLADLLTTVHQSLAERRAHSPARLDPTRPLPSSPPLVVACDCPSGLNCDTGAIDPLALSADHTVTFALPKAGHLSQPGASACGHLTIADIHIDRTFAPAAAPDLLTPPAVGALLPPRPPSAHKGSFGRALIVAGSSSYPGAAAIACQAAARAGAGLVHLAAPALVSQLVASQLPEPIHTLLPSDPLAPTAQDLGALTPAALPALAPLLSHHDALLVGPGLGVHPRTIAFVEALTSTLLSAPHPPLVIDADALNALAKAGALTTGPAHLPPRSILTPHPGEMARLAGLTTAEINADRWEVARRCAREWNQIIVLKGAHTAIAHPEGALAISPFADAALATAGSGDVLAGVIVGLLAQGLEAWAAARAGVYLHALAGRLAAQSIGPTLLASEIAQYLPRALAQLRS